MSPRQIEVAKECYTPSQEEIETATEIVDAAEKAEREQRGIVIVNDNFVSPPTVKQAHKLLRRSINIADLYKAPVS